MNTFNKFMVSVGQNEIVFLRPVPQKISKEDALLLAAWLVALADDDNQFDNVRTEVANT